MTATRKLRLLVTYDGTDYHGWQRQAISPTIQEELERAFATVARVPLDSVEIAGAGRTDAGVHALGQVASVSLDTGIDLELLRRGMNALIAPGIAVREIHEAPPDFHARLSARGKVYRYTVWRAPHAPVLDRQRACWFRHPLDVEAMERGASWLRGHHDFAAFTTKAARQHRTDRTLDRLDLEVDGDRLTMTFQAKGFLYNMVRAISGTLIEIGAGRRHPDEILEILRTGLRKNAGDNAPAHGLCLLQVIYDPQDLR